MNNLIQALTAYTSTLEQQVAALEARVAQLEKQSQDCELVGKINQLEQQITEQAALIAALTVQPAAQPTVQSEDEPEIEIELVMEDEEEQVEQKELETLETLEESEEVIEPEPVMEVIPTMDATPTTIEIPTIEPEPAIEEPTIEPAAEKPASRPTQTTLFGSAVEDIRHAISLGDRFLFQRELFAGNGELMQKTLDELNGLSSLNEAMEYVSEKFDWDKETTAVQLFENVLRRRFGN